MFVRGAKYSVSAALAVLYVFGSVSGRVSKMSCTSMPAQCSKSSLFCAVSVQPDAAAKRSKLLSQRFQRSDTVLGSPCASKAATAGTFKTTDIVLVLFCTRQTTQKVRDGSVHLLSLTHRVVYVLEYCHSTRHNNTEFMHKRVDTSQSLGLGFRIPRNEVVSTWFGRHKFFSLSFFSLSFALCAEISAPCTLYGCSTFVEMRCSALVEMGGVLKS